MPLLAVLSPFIVACPCVNTSQQSQVIIACAQVVDGELEEDTVNVNRASLTQHFPFEACPPTTNQASHSPCLQRLIDAITAEKDSMTLPERNSLVKVCSTPHSKPLHACFQICKACSEEASHALLNSTAMPTLALAVQMHPHEWLGFSVEQTECAACLGCA